MVESLQENAENDRPKIVIFHTQLCDQSGPPRLIQALRIKEGDNQVQV